MSATTTPSASEKTAPTYPVREKELMLGLQLTRDEIRGRRTRFLVQGAHWDYVNRAVMYSAVGAEIIRATKNRPLPPPETPTSPAPKARRPVALLLEKNPAPVPFTGELIAWKSPQRNERLLIAYIPGTDPENPRNLVNVLVRTNRNFLRGMKLKAHHVEDNRYELIGPCPRFRGRF